MSLKNIAVLEWINRQYSLGSVLDNDAYEKQCSLDYDDDDKDLVGMIMMKMKYLFI